MSDSAAIKGAVAILRSSAPEGIRIAHALAVLEAGLEELEPDPTNETPRQRARRLAAERAAKYRREKLKERDADRDERRDASVTPSVTGACHGSGSSSESSSLFCVIPEMNTAEVSDPARVLDRDEICVTVTRDASVTSVTPLRLVTDDGAPKTKRGTRAPSSVDPAAADFCRLHGIPPPTPGSEAAAFLDYWAQRVRDATSLDWPARWRCRPEWTKRRDATAKQPVAAGGRAWRVGDGA